MANRFWVGSSGSWDATTTHWSTTSGGASGASVPTSSDDVFFDANSGGGSVSFSADRNCKNLTLTGWTGTFAVSSFSIVATGSVVLPASTGLSLRLKFSGLSANQTLTSNASTISYLTIDAGIYTVSLLSDLRATSNMFLTTGTLDANGFNVTSSYLTTAIGTTMVMGSGTWTFTGSVSISSSTTVTPGTSTLVISGGSLSVNGAGITLGTVEFQGHCSILTDCTYTVFRAAAGSFISFKKAKTQTSTSFVLTGSASQIITLTSDFPGSPFILSKSSGSVTASYTSIKDSTATGGATFSATNSVDQGGNTGWTFGALPLANPDWSAIGKEDDKEYLYKVSDASGAYIGIWRDVVDELTFTQRINTPGTTTTVKLARSPASTTEVRSNLLTEAGENLITEDSFRYTTVYETPNSVGAGTDVELNYNVDVYVVYGQFDNLVTEAGDRMITEAGDYYKVATGAPLGAPVFRGYILDYESTYSADAENVTVTLASHGNELNQELIRSGTTTTVTYTTTELATQLKGILDTNPGKMSYNLTSIATTGVSPTLKFELNTKLEGIESIYNQTPDGWYWFANPADNLVYLQATAGTPAHTFILGKHIKSISLRRSIETLKNAVWFVGGETTPGTPSTAVYKYYEDAASQAAWRKGIERITDRRYTIAANMSARATKLINRYKNPIYTTPLTISSARYDIETIQLGDLVTFAGFGNFVDGLQLQVVERSYTPTAVSLQLGELQDRLVDQITDVSDDLANDQYGGLPTVPS